MPRGGARPNSGPKPKSKPSAESVKLAKRLGKDVAGEVLDSIDERAYWRFLLAAGRRLETVDANTAFRIERTLTYLTNRAHGKPVEAIVTDSGGLEKLAERLQAARNRK